MINEEKINNQITSNINEQENIHISNEDNLINTLKNELTTSEEKIKEIISTQNKEIFKIKNRLMSEIERCQKFSLENLIVEFLSIVDNIERASSLIQKEKEITYMEILKDIENILCLIKNVFIQFQVSKIHDIKVTFDPNIHQAISVQYDNKTESNKVLKVMQSGYIMHNIRLLRPAMVVVSTNKK
ncbi:hypothetical protein IX46_01325 [Buchnera aphidicola (Aphis glycines)]|uniref:Protein GrpE n=1 Tax=Buchnera aphidicola (Aphis glycines) TaxID=1265350 RepID=A0A0M3RSH6_9GAMM|nr:nucleotide exchange factor GrpE [Buchnera aphidicola]ALD15206.1 hypothetical protein IX46_01325 [Buchnera aphidicola (Aphis glycines)]